MIIGLGEILINNNVNTYYKKLCYFNEYILSLSSKDAYDDNNYILKYKEIEKKHNFHHKTPIKIKFFNEKSYVFFAGYFHYNDKIIEIINLLNLHNNLKVLFKLREINEIDKSIELSYFKAIALARIGQKQEAMFLLNELIEIVPQHRKAVMLLTELKNNSKKADMH